MCAVWEDDLKTRTVQLDRVVTENRLGSTHLNCPEGIGAPAVKA